jgi:hypothetical protein
VPTPYRQRPSAGDGLVDERKSKLTLLAKVEDAKVEHVQPKRYVEDAMARLLEPLAQHVHTITLG